MSFDEWIPGRGTKVFGATETVGRVFFICSDCKRVVPRWRVIRERVGGKPIGCKCGLTKYNPRNIPEWQAAWWVLIRGWLWRNAILRKKTDWDPRMPWRDQPAS